MEQYLSKLSNGKQVNLSELSIEAMQKLLFDEECSFCERALQLPPFSLARKEVLNKGYEFVTAIKEEIAKKRGRKLESQGASKKSINLLIKLLAEKMSKGEVVMLYEAGVGIGYALKEILSRFDNEIYSGKMSVKGCDIYLHPKMQSLIEQNPVLDIVEGDIIDSIRNLPDESIDVFYADNVIEHFLPDEAEIIFSEITKKMKPGAYFYVLIPNKHVGPHDVSRHFLPFGSKALSTHFMEMSFNEVTTTMRKYNLHHSHCVFLIPKTNIIFSIKNQTILKIKLRVEPILAKVPTKFLRKSLIFAFCGYNISVMKKIS